MKVNFINPSLYLASFITFIGYYLVVLLVLYFGSEQMSRLFTVPTRLFATLLMILIIINKGYYIGSKSFPKLLFTIFSCIYLGNVFIDFIGGGEIFESRSATQIFMYYMVYAIVPFYFFSQIKKDFEFEMIFKALVMSGIILSIVSLYIYRDILIGGYSRISMASNDINFDLISPLSLSYSASLLIGVCIAGFLYNKDFLIKKKYLIFGIVIGVAPFLLGASRGSLLSLVVPFFIVIYFQKGAKSKINILLSILVFSATTFWLADSVGSGIFDRFFQIDEDIASSSSSAIRIVFWDAALQQFLNSPIFGDSIHFELNNYPHNLIIESLMATGIIGTTPLFVLIGYMFYKSSLIVKYCSNYNWIVIAFWQGFISSMFSYAIYNNIIFYATLGLLVGVNINKKH